MTKIHYKSKTKCQTSPQIWKFKNTLLNNQINSDYYENLKLLRTDDPQNATKDHIKKLEKRLNCTKKQKSKQNRSKGGHRKNKEKI